VQHAALGNRLQYQGTSIKCRTQCLLQCFVIGFPWHPATHLGDAQLLVHRGGSRRDNQLWYLAHTFTIEASGGIHVKGIQLNVHRCIFRLPMKLPWYVQIFQLQVCNSIVAVLSRANVIVKSNETEGRQGVFIHMKLQSSKNSCFQFGTVLYVAETFAWNSQRSALTAQPDATRQTHAVVKRSFSGIDVSLSMVFELFGKQRWFSQPQPELGRMCGQVRRIWVALWRVICQEGLSLEIALAVYALWNRGRSHHHGIGLTSGLQEAGLMILHRFSRRPFVPSW